MEQVHSHKDLIVWKKSIELVVEIYLVTDKFPREEVYGLTSQIRRAAVSIPSNIAEGRCRGTRKEFRQFLLISFGSASELETQLIISRQLPKTKSLNYSKVDSLLSEVLKMLNSIIKKLEPST